MKRFFSILALVAFTFALISCGGDDGPNRPEGVPQSVNDAQSYTFEILANSNSTFGLEQEIKLEDFVKLKDYIKYVRKADMKSDSHIKITGVDKGGYTLTDVVLKVKGTDIQRKIKEVNKDDTYNSLDDLEFIDRVEKRMVSKKKIILLLQGKTDKEINKDVKVEIKLSAKFTL